MITACVCSEDDELVVSIKSYTQSCAHLFSPSSSNASHSIFRFNWMKTWRTIRLIGAKKKRFFFHIKCTSPCSAWSDQPNCMCVCVRHFYSSFDTKRYDFFYQINLSWSLFCFACVMLSFFMDSHNIIIARRGDEKRLMKARLMNDFSNDNQ